MDHHADLARIAAELAETRAERRHHTNAANDARTRERALDQLRRTAAREALADGLTQQDIAKDLGVTRSRVAQLLAGD